MQLVSASDLHARAVITKSGTKLGQLKDLVIDIDSGRVAQYVVKQGLIMTGPDLLIAAEEIVEITKEAVIVQDTSISVSSAVLA